MNSANQSTLSTPLQDALFSIFGSIPRRLELLSGGMICQAARLDFRDETVFLKWNEAAPDAMFAREAQGLRLLQATQTLRVPKVLFAAPSRDNCPAFLLLEWIENTPIEALSQCERQLFWQQLGEDLAALHRSDAGTTFGLENDNFLGALPQLNSPQSTWSAFFRENRLQPQIEWARRRGLVCGERETNLRRIVEQLETLLRDLNSRPSLLHGDLWSGNLLAHSQSTLAESTLIAPVVVDPAVYRGEREMEIAYCELFGGFDAAFYDAYGQNFPLQDGYARRRELHQIYHLLNHLNHFGEQYGALLDAACIKVLSPR